MADAERRSLGQVSRRQFLRAGAVAVGVGAVGRMALGAASGDEDITIGVFTDAHYANRDARGSRHYRDSAAKLEEFVRTMNAEKPALAIVLGDFVDKGKDVATEKAYLHRIEGIYRGFKGQRHHVIGNHDVATLTKDQFLSGTGGAAPHYAFDAGPFHFIVLDACYRKDGRSYAPGNFKWSESLVPPGELKWLASDLRATKKPTVVFVHQRLDEDTNVHTVQNAAEVRRVLEKSDKVRAVFSGHDHKGGYTRIGGIHYVTMRAMVEGPGTENNAYALVRITPTRIHVRGFAKQPERDAREVCVVSPCVRATPASATPPITWWKPSRMVEVLGGIHAG